MAIRLSAIDDLLKRFGKLDHDSLMKKVMSNSSMQQDIIDLNTQNQLYEKGITADGIYMGDYSASTIEGTGRFKGKKQKEQRYDHITLSDTKETYESERVVVSSTGILLKMDTTIHGVDLQKEFGNIVGLTTESKSIMFGWLKGPFVNEMRKAVFK